MTAPSQENGVLALPKPKLGTRAVRSCCAWTEGGWQMRCSFCPLCNYQLKFANYMATALLSYDPQAAQPTMLIVLVAPVTKPPPVHVWGRCVVLAPLPTCSVDTALHSVFAVFFAT